jgi:nitronate monooxygenase
VRTRFHELIAVLLSLDSQFPSASSLRNNSNIRMSAASTVATVTDGSSAPPLKIYFCASIRGEEVSKPFLNQLITHLKTKHGRVLTEHIGYDSCEVADQTNKGIYDRDVSWLNESDICIAECSSASLGVGYELAYAEKQGKPILVLYRWPRADKKHISGMISGCAYPGMVTKYYKDEFEAAQIMDDWIQHWRTGVRFPLVSNDFTALLPGLKVPLLVAPMAGRSGSALVLASARAGALGMLGVGTGKDLPWLKEQLEKITSAIQAAGPSAVNLVWGAGFMNFALDRRPEALDLVLQAKPRVVFLSFGESGVKYAEKSRAAGVQVIISQVQTVEDAIASATWCDALVLQGSEAGGHGRSDFTRQQLLDGVLAAQSAGQLRSNLPLLLAGGLGSHSSISSAFSLASVSGLSMGTRFLACEETDGPREAKELAIRSSGEDTTRSEVYDLIAAPGLWPKPYDGRAIAYPLAKEFLSNPSALLEPSVQSAAGAKFQAGGGSAGKNLTVWAGTDVGSVTKEEPAAEVIRTISEAMVEGERRRKDAEREARAAAGNQ